MIGERGDSAEQMDAEGSGRLRFVELSCGLSNLLLMSVK